MVQTNLQTTNILNQIQESAFKILITSTFDFWSLVI